MNFDWLILGNFVVLSLTFLALLWYAWETRGLKKASLEQLEALSMPCVAFGTFPRDPIDAVLEANDVAGEMTIQFQEGQAVIVNMGNGPAVNVAYALEPIGILPGANVARPRGYIQNIPPGKAVVTPISRGALQTHQFEFTARYESLSGRRYETQITVNELVLTNLRFVRR